MNRKAILGLTLIVLTALSGAVVPAVMGQEEKINIAFYISLLSPNTNPARNQWAKLMEQQLPKIGIGVKFHDSTGWANIAPRTWGYPVGQEYDHIPTYDEGGYDILFIGWAWGLDWDPTGLFDTASITPNGDNFYQYSNPTYDQILNQYITDLDETSRLQKVKQIQAILYNDLPAITIIYPRSLFGFKKGLTGINDMLLATTSGRYEYWDDPADHVIKYALPAELAEYNIYTQESYYDALWMTGVYAGLYARTQSADYHYEALIADGMPVVSADGTQFNVTINPNAKFSDGNNVTAEDIKYTYQLHMTPAVSSSSYGYLTTFFESNDSIVVIDDHHIQFNLAIPYAWPLGLLSYGIIEKSKVEPLIASKGYDIFGQPPLSGDVGDALVTSCGPFKLKSYDTATSTVILEPNPHYVGDAPKLSQLIFTWINGKDAAISALSNGEVDIMDSQYVPNLSDFIGLEDKIETHLVKDPGTQEMAINMKHPIIGTGELTPLGTTQAANYIRKAISHAIPRNTIVEQILHGLGAPGVTPMPDAAVGFDTSLQPYLYDLDYAINLVEKAGYKVRTTVEAGGIEGLVFITFLGLASLLAIRRFRRR